MSHLTVYVLALALAGCASINYDPVQLDSPFPFDEANVSACPSVLAKSRICHARVEANRWVSLTGIQMKEGETYCLTVPDHQLWFDKDRRNTPTIGDYGNWLMRLFSKRHPEAPYFSLIAATVEYVSPPATTARQVIVKANQVVVYSHQVVEQRKEHKYKTAVAGKLVLYPNDAIGFASDPERFYENNAGYIWVKIENCSV